MMEDSGISPTGLAMLMVIWSGTTVLFEIPSGVLGDLFPRKFVLLAGASIEALAFVTWWLWPSFWGFACGFVLWSLGGSLASGTGEAYLHDLLERKTDYQKIYGRSEAVEGVAIALALLCGGFLAEGGYTLPLLLSVAAPLTGGLILFFWLPHAPSETNKERESAEEQQQEDEDQEEPGFQETLIQGGRFTFSNAQIRYIILAGASIGALAGTFEEYIGVLLAEQDITLVYIGVIYSAVWLARTLGTLAASHMHTTTLQLPLILTLGTSIILALVLILSGQDIYFIVFALLLYFGTGGLLDVVFSARLQEVVEPKLRATMTSFQSMALEVTAILSFFGFGIVAELFNWHATLWVIAWSSIVLASLWLWLGRTTLQQRATKGGS